MAAQFAKAFEYERFSDGDGTCESYFLHLRRAIVPLRQFVDVIRRDLAEGQAQLVGAGRDVPEHVTKLVFELAADLVVYDAAVVALDLFDDVGDLARLTGEAAG